MLALGCAGGANESTPESDADSGLAPGLGSGSGSESTADIPQFDCDILGLLEQRCGGETCHGSGSSSAAGLDLLSPHVEDRVSGAPGTGCGGLLADPSDPQASVLYTKVTEPVCGVLMPMGGQPLDQDELSCMETWISGLLPPSEGCEDCECEPGIVEPCYSGPKDTADVGMCKSGTHMCQTNGMGWLACEGEITPFGENCFTPDLDENCDGQTPECSEVWALLFGDSNDQAMRSVVVDDATGDIYSFGDFEGVVSFGGEPLTAEPSDPLRQDFVVAKHDLYGNPQWALRFGDSSTQIGQKMAMDDDGNLVFVGRMYGTVDIGGGTLHASGGNDVVVFKLDDEGNHIWSQVFGGKEPDRAARLAFDPQGNVVVTGAFTGEADFGDFELEAEGQRDAFVAVLHRDTGEPIFVIQIGSEGDDYGFGVDVDDNGDIVVAGRFGGPLEIGGHMVSYEGDLDVYLARLDHNGQVLWAESFGGPGKDEAHDLRIQQNGDIVLLGAMSGAVDFGGGPLVSAGMRDIFVATFDDHGNHVWSANYGDVGDQFEADGTETWLTLFLDDSGNIYFGGSLYGTLDFGGDNQLVANGDKPDVFHAKLTADGDYIGGRRFGGTGSDFGHGFTVTAAGHVIHAGRARGKHLYAGEAGVFKTNGRTDGFLVKLAPL